MTARQRLARLAPVVRRFPGLGCRSVRDLEQWLALELGSVNALDGWVKRGPHRARALPPQAIYHILAGNLAVSGQQSILCGLLLGARNIVKLPSRGGEGIEEFIHALPAAFRSQVSWSRELDAEALARAEAVIAYGDDSTIAAVRARTRADQIFLGYGLQVSLIWLGRLKKFTPRLVNAIAHDVCLYDQMGCLSPQAIYLEPGSATADFGAALAEAMTVEIGRQPDAPRTAADYGVIRGTVDTALGMGHFVWPVETSQDALAGAVIVSPQPNFRFSCLHRVITIHEAKPTGLSEALAAVRGKISTLGIAEPLEKRLENVWLELGVKRFCPVGTMQHPPLWWHHDGRPAISDLVRWVDNEIK